MRNSKGEGSKPYRGSLTFTNQTISFGGTTIQLRNVTRVGTYELKRSHRISPLALAIAVIVFFLSFSTKGWGIISILAAAIAGYGIYEYFRPKLYALIIELNSSYHYTLSSTDREGILQVRNRITSAMNATEPVNTTVNFNGDKIIFGDHVGRDKYEIHNSKIGKVGSFDNNSEKSL
ncbi:DUF6232 family protein [Chitinophaga filiformis]|uniref:Uncharacterized protein n=1 Tax=Chitinophaga filiformis TaxID=104663 RepID=A0A1G7X2Q0_CHIFI|nr:DUF6232 family protein [Chitinophaga filiformis]SDG78463.1 hypothetical protein SAMN04488121_106276 [Chitinophaga filiformis]